MPVHLGKLTDNLSLVNRLNVLLDALHLPIILKTPTDLTPSLLITILEAILCTRFPLDLPSVRDSAQLQRAKFFLGVLETDVLEVDVGLSNMDPRRLANGEWDEVIFIGELLCWVGRRHGIIPADQDAEGSLAAHQPPPTSPSISSSTKQEYTASSFSTHRRPESITSVESLETVAPTRKRSPPPSVGPRCIHEVPSPSIILSPDLDNSFAGPSSFPVADAPRSREPSVRYTGYISPVDEELELLSFESTRSISDSHSGDHRTETSPVSLLTALRESHARTLFLKQERARLLAELAKYENLRSP